MKTRVIQNEPDEPIADERPADRPGKTRNNPAYAMARWVRRTARRRSSARGRDRGLRASVRRPAGDFSGLNDRRQDD